jgi:hypothetical protein
MKTRTKSAAKATTEPTDSKKSVTPKVQLGSDSNNPPQLFILPKDASNEARFISLTNPRYSIQNRYFVCPERGFHELTRVAAPRTTPRSWLLASDDSNSRSGEAIEDERDEDSSKGYITRNADLFVVTPIDSLFVVLPAIAPLPTLKTPEPTKRLFLSGEDYFDKLTSSSPHLARFLRIEPLRKRLEKRMAVVCDTVEAGDETMFRLNEEKLLNVLLQKARGMVGEGLIPSMEEKLVKRALDVPLLSIKRGEVSTQKGVDEETVPTESTPESRDTQSTAASTDAAASSFSGASTTVTSFSEDATVPKDMKATTPSIDTPEGIEDLLRLRTAFSFICSKYLAPHVTSLLKAVLASPGSTVDFGPLDAHLAHLTKLRQEALASRSLGDFSRKRGFDEDEEGGETRGEKKRKKEEEEKQKRAGESRGIKNLKKANISGMKKMSDFFKKK